MAAPIPQRPSLLPLISSVTVVSRRRTDCITCLTLPRQQQQQQQQGFPLPPNPGCLRNHEY
eukprot:2439603-Amphidinium_carterae.1